MKIMEFAEIQVYNGHDAEGGAQIKPEDYGIDAEFVNQNATPASYAQALFDELWNTGKLSANAFNELLNESYAYGIAWNGDVYYLGACRDFGIEEK